MLKFRLICTGKTTDKYVHEGIAVFEKRIKRFAQWQIDEIVLPKWSSSLNAEEIKTREAELIRKKLDASAFCILLDEKGKQFSSVQFADKIEKLAMSASRIDLVIGGAYGFDESLKQEAGLLMSLSKMTYNHQLVRLVIVEQVYRALSIINHQPYHNA